MRLVGACLAIAVAVLAGLPRLALAQPVNGLYVSGSFGAAFPHGQIGAPAAPGEQSAPLPDGSSVSGRGGVGQGSIGYGFGNGLRLEMEGTGGAGGLRLPREP
jgi:OOP family OmpA-OmpF porin